MFHRTTKGVRRVPSRAGVLAWVWLLAGSGLGAVQESQDPRALPSVVDLSRAARSRRGEQPGRGTWVSTANGLILLQPSAARPLPDERPPDAPPVAPVLEAALEAAAEDVDESLVVASPLPATEDAALQHSGLGEGTEETLVGEPPEDTNSRLTPAPDVASAFSFSAGVDQTILLPDRTSLPVTVRLNGIVIGAPAFDVHWSQVSGPGRASFAGEYALEASVRLDSAGEYLFELEVSGASLGTRASRVYVSVILSRPEASASPPPARPENAARNERAPAASPPPAPPRIAEPSSSSSVSVPADADWISPGLTSESDAAVEPFRIDQTFAANRSVPEALPIEAASSDSNVLPRVEAGPGLEAAPGEPVELRGEVSDDRLPAGTLTVLWSQLSGPGAARFGDATRAVTTAVFPTDGTYRLSLEASDGEGSASDEVVVEVRSAGGTRYYVSTSGDDANPGSEALPFRSLARGVSAIESGDTLYLREGTYRESLRSTLATVPSGRSFDEPVTVRGYPGETVVLRPAGGPGILYFDNPVRFTVWRDLVLDGSDMGGSSVGIGLVGSASHNRFRNLEIRNLPGSGIYVSGVGENAHNEFLGLDVHDVARGASGEGHGIQIAGPDNLIDGGDWHDIAGSAGNSWAIRIDDPADGAARNRIRNTRVYRNAHGLAVGGGDGNRVSNNLIYDNSAIPVQIGYGERSTGNAFLNNTVVGNAGPPIQVFGGHQTRVVNNILWANGMDVVADSGSETLIEANLDQNPLFADEESRNFHLTEGSPARDAGAEVEDMEEDFDGTPRPQGSAIDIGAYEWPAPSAGSDD